MPCSACGGSRLHPRGITFGIKPRQHAAHDDANAFIAKLGPEGNILWGRHFEGPGEQNTWWVAPDALGHVVATGRFEGSIAIDGVTLESRGKRDIRLARLRP